MDTSDDLLPVAASDPLDARTRHALEVAARAREWADQLLTVRGSGAWGGVRAEVDVHGVLVDVRLERPGAVAGAELALRAVRGAYGAALVDAHAHLAARARRTWGDDPLAHRIVAESAARLGLDVDASGPTVSGVR